MPLTQEEKTRIRLFVLERCVPAPKEILESGGFVPDDVPDAEAYAEVKAVLDELRRDINNRVRC